MGLCIVMFLIQVGLISGIPVSDYNAAFKNWENTYKSTTDEPLYCESCLNEAKKKARNFNSYTEAERDAVAIVNMYTQEKPQIYTNLNRQLRCGTLTPVMALFRNLLDSAIDILSKKDNFDSQTVYRGTKRCDNIGLGEYKFAGFTSTTTNPQTAFEFGFSNGMCGIYIVINRAMGLSLNLYSKYPGEDEILLKSGTLINVKKFIKNATDIQNEMVKFWPSFSRSNLVKIFVEGDYISGSGSSRKKRSTKIIDECAVSGVKKLVFELPCFIACALFFYFKIN